MNDNGKLLVNKFKDCMSKFATGVVVITLKQDNNQFGVTINSFCSLSLEPMLVMFSIKKTSNIYNKIISSENFTINILSHSQKNICNIFTKPLETNWSEINYFSLSNSNFIVLNSSLAYIACNKKQIYDAGDHSIIIGEVIELDELNSTKSPLIYYNRNFFNLDSN